MFQVAFAEARIPFIERFSSASRRVIRLHDFQGELLLRLERMQAGRRCAPEEQFIITRHQLIGDTHQFAEHVRGGLVDGDKIAKALAHLLRAVEPFENRQEKNYLLRHGLFSLKIASDQNIKKLVCPSEFHVGLHHHRIPSLHNWILNFVRADGLLLIDSRLEVFALQ